MEGAMEVFNPSTSTPDLIFVVYWPNITNREGQKSSGKGWI